MDAASNGARREPTTHKSLRQRLERVESSLNAVPPAMEEAVDGLESHCTAGIKLASLLETVLQDSPLLLLVLRYKEACETLLDKTSRAGLAMKGELVAPVKRLGPTVSRLRSHIDSHAKAYSRHQTYLKQLEGATLSSSSTPRKLEQVEAKFQSSAQEFAEEDHQLCLAKTEFSQMRMELMGGCFLGYLEVVSRVLESASDLLAPLGAYKELRHDLRDSPASSSLKEATVSWLAATQVNQSLRSFGGLSRNDVQCMLYQHPDGLPDTIRSGLNSKVDQLLKMYRSELVRVETPHHVLTGGFHFNPKAIELALKDCCSELEAKGAGADHAHTLETKEEQISCDVPRTTYVIGGQQYGAATGEMAVANVAEKMAAVRQLLDAIVSDSAHQSDQSAVAREHLLDDFAQHVLNESCTTVTNTTAKTAVQLVFGKANLVLVRPSPSNEDNQPVEIAARISESTLTVTVHSSWWLVEDYAAFAVLQRPMEPTAALGVVDACYTISLSLSNYSSDSPSLELPSVSVSYRQPPPSPPATPSSPPHPVIGSKEKEKLLGSFTTLRKKFWDISQKTRVKLEGRGRAGSPQGGGVGGGATLRTYVDLRDGGGGKEREEREPRKRDMEESASSGGGGRYLSGRGDSFGRGVRAAYPRGGGGGGGGGGMRRVGSDETISSQSTLVARTSLLEADDHPLGIADLINAPSRPTLTQSRVMAHDKYRQQRYYRERKVRSESKDDDQRTIEGSPGSSSQEISIASEMELERVYSLLSGKNSALDYQFSESKSGYQQDREGSGGGYGGDGYKPRDGKSYGYKYGYGGSAGYGGGEGRQGQQGEREKERERVEEQKKEDNGSSGSSGIEDHSRSHSGSAASLHQEGGGRGRLEGRPASNSSIDSGFAGVRGRAERAERTEGVAAHGEQHLPFDFSKGLGSLIHSGSNYDYRVFDRRSDRPPVSSSSSEGSSPVMFRTRSEENVRHPERSSSRSSTHSMPPGPLHNHGSSTSLNDFDHTPGSRPRPSFDSLSQEDYWDYHHHHHPGPALHHPGPALHHSGPALHHPGPALPADHYRGHPPYSYSGPPPPPPPGGPGYEYEGGYGDPSPHDRHMYRGMRGHSEEYSPSPGPPPPMDHRHQPPPPPPPQYWPGPGFDHPPPQAGGRPPPQMPIPRHPPGPPGPGPPGSRFPGPPHPMNDDRFRQMQFRPITPSSPSPASLHSMSPGQSPHPTPPPTPPPPHGPPRPLAHGGPPMPAPYHSPRPHMHPPRDFRPPPPPPHAYQGPMPPREPNFGPPRPFGPSPGPPVSGPGRFPAGPSWDHGWGPH